MPKNYIGIVTRQQIEYFSLDSITHLLFINEVHVQNLKSNF